MFSINGISYKLPCCSHETAASTAKTEILKHKVEHTWNQLCILIKSHVCQPVQTQIQHEIDKVDQVEAKETKPIFVAELRRAFANSMAAIKEADMNPEKLPKQVALQLTAILKRFGIAIYASNDVQHPFQSSLDVLKTAILMQQYALGISKRCPDLSRLVILDDLYTNAKICSANASKANEAINNMDPETWAAKTFLLTEKQQMLIPELLRYTQGALGYLNLSNLDTSRHLLETAEAVLVSAQKKSFFNQTEVNNYLAELKYNNITGFLAEKIKDAQAKGQTAEAEEIKRHLSKTWEECIFLSKDPEKMKARCYNKRGIFIEKLSLEKQLESGKKALDCHLSLPQERQDAVLIALAHHNLSHIYAELNDIGMAVKHSNAALALVAEARNKGENNAQFDSVLNHAQDLAALNDSTSRNAAVS